MVWLFNVAVGVSAFLVTDGGLSDDKQI